MLAKYASAALVFVTFLSPIWVCHVLLAGVFDSSPDWGHLTSVTLGLVDLGLVYLAVGTLASAVTSMQLWAALLAVLGNFVVMVVGYMHNMFPPESALSRILAYASLYLHLESAAQGIIDLRHVVFQLSVVGLLLFWTVRIVESRRWK